MVFLLVLSTIPALAGAQTFKNWMQLGTEAMEEGEFLTAAIYFQEAFTLDSTNFEATIRYADALRLSRNYVEAERLYEKAYQKDKGRLYPEGQYYLAQMQLLNADYAQALRNFSKYEKRLKRDQSSIAYLKLKQELASCSLALNARMPDPYTHVSPLKGEVNTDKSEFAPFRLDSVLYFTASGERSAEIGQFRAPIVGDSTLRVTPVNGPWDVEDPHGNLVFSPDRTRAYFAECSDGLCAIYEANVLTDGSLSEKRSITTVNQSGITATMPMVATYQSREVLFFASDRKGTRGGLDIWWSMRTDDGQWEPPVNAGDNINTPGNEITPWYTGEALYFSSDWLPGFGGYDVFKSEGYPRSFDLPVNLGRPINSSLNDLYYRYFVENRIGYLASNREGSLRDGSFCCNDLYSVVFDDSVKTNEPIPTVYTSLRQLNEYLPVTLYFHNDEPNPRTRDTLTNTSYDMAYSSYLNLKPNYTKALSKGVRGEEADDVAFEVDEFFTFFVEKGMRDLEVFTALLLEELEKGVSIELTIKGYASPRAKSDYNVKLTSRRIHSLINYLNKSMDGALRPFIEQRADNHATLRFEKIPFGEYRADAAVSDELDDRQASIYSRGARLERKIEIISVERGTPDSLFSVAQFSTLFIDFGEQRSLEPIQTYINLMSAGTDTLTVDSLVAPCGCTSLNMNKHVLPPGDMAAIAITFDPSGLSGLVTRKILAYIRGREAPYEIVIAGEFSSTE